MKPEATALEQVGVTIEAIQLAGPGAGAAVGHVDDAPEGSAALLGKRVLIAPLDPCGQCEICRRGGSAVCPTAMRRAPGERPARVRVSSRWTVALADGLDVPGPAAAAIAGDVTTAYTLYARTGLGPREPVVVLGHNAVARFLVEILRSKGITPAVVVPADDTAWRDWLVGKGAMVIANEDHLVEAITAAIASQGQGARPWRLLVTDASALPHAASLAGPRATITVLTTATMPALPADVLAREVTIIGVAGGHPDLIVEAAALCAKGDVNLASGVVLAPTTSPTCTTIAT